MDLNGEIFKLLDGGHPCGMVVITTISYTRISTAITSSTSRSRNRLEGKRERETSTAKGDDVNGMSGR